jgi:23S rRNA (uracil1939-C5)-methyltransferase
MAAEKQLLDARIIDLTHDGKGVADLSGRRMFVSGALPGERAVVALGKGRKRHREAELVRVLQASEARVEPHCEYFGRCGGCALQHSDYGAQVRFKEAMAKDALERIGGVRPERWLAAQVGPQWGYRRRARLGVKFVEGKGRVLVGFRERAKSYVTDMSHCPVLAPPLNDVLGELAAVIAESSVKRRLPQIEAAVGDEAAAIVLRVLQAPSERDVRSFSAFGQRHGIDVYLQSGGPGTVEPLNAAAVRPLGYRLGRFGVTLNFAPTDFVQVNAAINEKMVETAVDLLEIEAGERLLDLYCGLGNFSLPMAKAGAEVLGVEGEASLVARAAANARLNGVEEAQFVVADLNRGGWRFQRQRWDLVVLDPPRTGAAEVVAEMTAMSPRRIAYVSCHPGTLARDARALSARGYRLRVAGLFDMFPHTHHAEMIAIFDRA